MAAEKGRHRQILNDDGVRSRFPDTADFLHKGGELSIGHKGIDGNVDLHPPAMGIGHRLGKGGFVKVLGIAPGVEALSAQVYGVGPRPHGGDQLLLAPNRGKNLH